MGFRLGNGRQHEEPRIARARVFGDQIDDATVIDGDAFDGLGREAREIEFAQHAAGAVGLDQLARIEAEDQQVIRGTLSTIARKVREAKLTRTALILVGPVLDAHDFRDSALYDAAHEHVLRNRKTAQKKSAV